MCQVPELPISPTETLRAIHNVRYYENASKALRDIVAAIRPSRQLAPYPSSELASLAVTASEILRDYGNNPIMDHLCVAYDNAMAAHASQLVTEPEVAMAREAFEALDMAVRIAAERREIDHGYVDREDAFYEHKFEPE
jgi:hypothetical protein